MELILVAINLGLALCWYELRRLADAAEIITGKHAVGGSYGQPENKEVTEMIEREKKTTRDKRGPDDRT